MPLHFSRLKNEMSYFENADELTIESVLDLMFDLYSDVEEGIGIGPEVCECDDCDALIENLIWMGTVFQNICRIYGENIAVSNSVNQESLAGIRADLEQEVLVLLKRKDAYEKTKDRVVALQKEKRILEGELSVCKQRQPDLKTLENRVNQLKEEKDKAEQDRNTRQNNCSRMKVEIENITEEIGRLDEEIAELTPSVNVLTSTLNARRGALTSLNAQIESGDVQIQNLNDKIERLRKDIERSDREGILRHLQDQKSELEQIKTEIAGCISVTRQYEKEIRGAEEEKRLKERELDQKRREQEKMQQELEQLEGVFDGLRSNQEQYNKLKRRYNSLKMIAEQLQKDGEILCKRTGMEKFSLQDDLERGMNAVGAYLSAVAAAIDQYSRKAEDCL